LSPATFSLILVASSNTQYDGFQVKNNQNLNCQYNQWIIRRRQLQSHSL
jgi:hypothetical protein